ncbi:hypothetical protein JW998_11125 [candidate division KSB1 bacterium]|nr:hypothetical protein [candidate division KSB1 bacterium]
MITIISSKISRAELKEICQSHFGTMVKFVIDIQNEMIREKIRQQIELLVLNSNEKMEPLA